MALKRREPRRRASITSLIDVIFLLLLFFMLSSTFSRFSQVELVSTAQAEGGAGEASTVQSLTVQADGVLINGLEQPDTSIIATLDGLGSDGDLSLTVTAADGVTTQRFVDVLTILASKSDLDIRLLEPTT
ncbi:MAG: biopolymer transporter ExbD [Pseudomonadota bacterium]